SASVSIHLTHRSLLLISFLFFLVTSTRVISSLSLHDALPISAPAMAPTCATITMPMVTAIPGRRPRPRVAAHPAGTASPDESARDRKSTRLNSSHVSISYAVFCLKKKTKPQHERAAVIRIHKQ